MFAYDKSGESIQLINRRITIKFPNKRHKVYYDLCVEDEVDIKTISQARQGEWMRWESVAQDGLARPMVKRIPLVLCVHHLQH